jgi:hypothetical protein
MKIGGTDFADGPLFNDHARCLEEETTSPSAARDARSFRARSVALRQAWRPTLVERARVLIFVVRQAVQRGT